MIDDVEARRPLRPVDRSDVQEKIERELRLEAAHSAEQIGGRDHDHEHAVGQARFAARGDELLLHQSDDRGGHDQKVSVMIGWREPAIRSCSFMIASMTVSGRGGHPGT